MMTDFHLSDAQLAAFEEDGFLVLPDVIEEECLMRLRAALQNRVQDLLRRYQQLGQSDGPGDDLNDNLIRLLAISSAAYQHIDISLPMLPEYRQAAEQWRALFGDAWRQEAGIYTHDSIFSLLTHPHIIHIARRLMGDEIITSPVQHVRIKPPQRALSGDCAVDSNTGRTLWHQDEAVVNESAHGVNILTVWVAISDATLENGCMQAVQGSHRRMGAASAADYGLTTHCPGKENMVAEVYIPERAIDGSRLVPLPVNAGGIVLLHQRTVHGAGANNSNAIRWSFDLRYQNAETATGRECFPETLVYSRNNPEQVVRDAETYRRRWLSRRDQIINEEIMPVFNSRWLKYNDTPVCA